MFQLYKQRNFSALINDTFTFFKAHGKNYFANYFAVNGIFLLILVVLFYLVGQVFFDAIFTNLNNPEGNRLIEQYFNNNATFFVLAAIGAGILLLVLTLLSYSYPVIYLQLFETNTSPTAKQITSALKKKTGRIIIFSLLWLVTFLPIAILLGFLSMLLIVIIIGIPFALIVFAAVFCWMSLSFYDYLNTNNGYFTSLRVGFNMLFEKFWLHSGSTALFYIMVYMLQGVISLIPYMIGIVSMLQNENNMDDPEKFSFFGIMMLVTIVLSTLLTYILGNLIFINQGMIYYSSREESENQSLYNEIDLIGRDGE